MKLLEDFDEHFPIGEYHTRLEIKSYLISKLHEFGGGLKNDFDTEAKMRGRRLLLSRPELYSIIDKQLTELEEKV